MKTEKSCYCYTEIKFHSQLVILLAHYCMFEFERRIQGNKLLL